MPFWEKVSEDQITIMVIVSGLGLAGLSECSLFHLPSPCRPYVWWLVLDLSLGQFVWFQETSPPNQPLIRQKQLQCDGSLFVQVNPFVQQMSVMVTSTRDTRDIHRPCLPAQTDQIRLSPTHVRNHCRNCSVSYLD